MGKHAYLIMAHTNMNQLLELVKCLDYEQNDIYIHVDMHFKNFSGEKFQAKFSNIFFTKRIKVYWGVFSNKS